MENIACIVEKNNWSSIRERVQSVCPSFAAVIDEIDPDNSYPLYRVKYPYGAMILDKGCFQIANNQSHLMPIHHSSVSNEIKENLGYSGTIPLGLVLEKGIETFVRSKHRVLPATFMGVGKLVSLWRVLDEGLSYFLGPFWSISSGARSICMLPKITDSASHKILKIKYGIKTHVPQSLTDHWELFSQISRNQNFPQPWWSELMFFFKTMV